ncbi:MAG: hypothetical protein AB8H03_20505 [Saprospiraceae bacterium]
MLKTRIWQSLKSLPAAKRNSFGKFLQSPYFNQREDLFQLFEAIQVAMNKEQEISKEGIWEATFSKQKYSAQNLRLLMSYLQKLFEQFIVVENVIQDKIQIKLSNASWFRNVGNEKLNKSFLRDSRNILEKQPLRNANYFYQSYQLELERYKSASRIKPDKGADFQQIVDNLDMAFLGMKLRESCLLLAHDQIYNWGFDDGFLEKIFEYFQEKDLLNTPVVSLYFYCYKMLQYPEEESWFQSFKQELLNHSHLFGKEEAKDLYLMAINRAIRKVNDGFHKYYFDIMDFYKEGLEKEYLLQDGVLSRFTYHNIVSSALQVDQADWAEKFIGTWSVRLERRFRERMVSFNQAKIAYHRKDYDAAIPLLQRANYHDQLLNLRARTLLLRIFYEIEEIDLLQSHLDAFSSYLRRKSGLGYHRTHYRNLIKYTKRLLALQFSDKEAVLNFKKNVEEERLLTDRSWLLGFVI